MPITVKKFNAQVRDPETGEMTSAGLLSNNVLQSKIPFPVAPKSKYGTHGQFLQTDGMGKTEWVDKGTPSYNQVHNAMEALLEQHSDWRATVQDGSLTKLAFSNQLQLETIKEYVTPEMYGAIGDGVTDDTDAINAAIEHGGYILFCNKNYLIDAKRKKLFNVPSNTIINLNNATLTMEVSAEENYQIFVIENVTNVKVCNGTIVGDRVNHTPDASQQWARLISIGNFTKNIYVEEMALISSYGDGVYIGDNPRTGVVFPENVYISKIYCDNCRRNGISVIHGTNLFIENYVCKNTNGHSPQAAIDVEPNVAGDIIQLYLDKIYSYNNIGGISISNNPGVENYNVFAGIIIAEEDYSFLVKSDFGNTVYFDNVIIKNPKRQINFVNNMNTVEIGTLFVELGSNFPSGGAVIGGSVINASIDRLIYRNYSGANKSLVDNRKSVTLKIGTIENDPLPNACRSANLSIKQSANDPVVIVDSSGTVTKKSITVGNDFVIFSNDTTTGVQNVANLTVGNNNGHRVTFLNLSDTAQRICPLGYAEIGTEPDVSYETMKIFVNGIVVAESTYPGYTTKTYYKLNPGCSVELVYNAPTFSWHKIG